MFDVIHFSSSYHPVRFIIKLCKSSTKNLLKEGQTRGKKKMDENEGEETKADKWRDARNSNVN
jgi:hypothetical protein